MKEGLEAGAEELRVPWHIQTLQLFPRNRKAVIFMPPTNPTIVPTQQKEKDLHGSYEPYNCWALTKVYADSCGLPELREVQSIQYKNTEYSATVLRGFLRPP